jgi:RimJ/RimL family protein N-acetyltransferase
MESICTNRLMGRKLQSDDYPFLRQLHTNPHVMEELGGVRDEGKTRENLEWNLAHWVSHGFGLWLFFTKEGGLPIGLIGIRKIEFHGKIETDLAFMLLPEFWSLGFAREGSEAVLDVAFHDLKVSSVIAKTRTSNLSSQRLIQKLGFTFENEVIDFNYPHFQYRLTNQYIEGVKPKT